MLCYFVVSVVAYLVVGAEQNHASVLVSSVGEVQELVMMLIVVIIVVLSVLYYHTSSQILDLVY